MVASARGWRPPPGDRQQDYDRQVGKGRYGTPFDLRNPAGFMQVASGARQRKILQIGDPALALWDDVFDVKGGSLEALVHEAILASSASAGPNCTRQGFRDAHDGCLPRICNAPPRTRDSCSLNSTNASSSSLSASCKSHSLCRSINF